MLEVREATPADAPAMAAVQVRGWQHAYAHALPATFLAGLSVGDRAARYQLPRRAPGDPVSLVAVADGRLLGLATVGPSRDGDRPVDGELLALYVDPGRWGGGVGRTLISAARARLEADGFSGALLWVLATNARAIAFYTRDGWADDGARRTERIGGVEVELQRHRRALS